MYYQRANYNYGYNNTTTSNTNRKKKKIIISICISVFVILSAGFFLTPISTLCKFMHAIKSQNSDKVIECIEPNKATMLYDIKNLLSDSLFETLMNSLLPANSDSDNFFSDEISVTGYNVKNVKLNWFNKTSCIVICLDIADKSGSKSCLNLSVNFIRVSSKWYIDCVSNTGLQPNTNN